MYNPALPNNYRDVKITHWKRAREEEQRNDIARSLATVKNVELSSFDLPEMISTSATDNFTNIIMSGNVNTIPLHLSAEELHQRRVRQSAALGISTAMQLIREDFEAVHKAKVAEGMDRKGRIRQKLGTLLNAAAVRKNNNEDGGNEMEITTGEMVPPPPTVLTSSLVCSSAPLVFHKSDLAAGGYVVKKDSGALERKKLHYGKPSSTILIRFLRDGPPVEIFDNNNNGEVRNIFLETIQDECGRCGVVRSVRYVLLSDEEKASLRARLEEKEKEENNNNVERRLACEMIRVFVRFDAVANAFKALETLQQRHEANWEVCFFPTQLFDAGTLGPSEAVGEAGCGYTYHLHMLVVLGLNSLLKDIRE